jgi:adenylate kinase family enzyme
MRRVIIVGAPGSGKSTLARALGRRLGLPVVHLDPLFWEPGWREPSDRAAFRDRVAHAVAGENWITDGNFVSDTFPLRLPRADTIVILDRSPWICFARILWRIVFERRRADLPAGCPDSLDGDLIAFVTQFRRATLPRIEAALAAHDGEIAVARLTSDRAVRAFLATTA